jgi:peroxiredoxin
MKTIMIVLSTLVMFIFPGVEKTGYEVGDRAMDFNLKNVDGNMVSLSDFKDAKGVIVAFTCNTCPVAQLYEQRIIDLHKKYASKGFPVVAIQPNDTKQKPGDSLSEMKKRAEEKNYPFAYVIDETQEVTRTFGATNTPHMYVLKNEGGKFIVKYIGAIDNNSRDPENVTKTYLEDAVDALLMGKEVPESKTKAIGCSIKWKSA